MSYRELKYIGKVFESKNLSLEEYNNIYIIIIKNQPNINFTYRKNDILLNLGDLQKNTLIDILNYLEKIRENDDRNK